ncbi:BQ2448_3327 [Microbotryum intermedium]|uniref:BQ2448_3327 protein n=1 Tax=Microbotryum intermedium TaxID=269621 RepID=A0A238FBJ2_9BASI|nr:BQ2448_3327 [Microbotryum intermedium]
MSLEATMLVLDNSSYSINGDFPPTRLEAQSDAVHVIFNRKLNANPESEVGVMVMAGHAPQVLVTPTQDEGKLIAALHTIKPSGQADLDTAIKVAQVRRERESSWCVVVQWLMGSQRVTYQLALKHRQNKNQRQRIIVFVASPITTTAATLSKLGKKMKKNNVAIDIVSFGSSSDSLDDASLVDLAVPPAPSSFSTPTPAPQDSSTSVTETTHHKLTTLYEAVNSSGNSHVLFVEPGPYLLSETISQSPILRGEANHNDEYSHIEGGGGAGEGSATGAHRDDDGFGVDPNLDPELAMALRMSLQEERARQQAAAAEAQHNASAGDGDGAKGETTIKEEERTSTLSGSGAMETDMTRGEKTAHEIEDVEIDEQGDDDDLAKALALSRGAEEEEEEEGADVEMDEDQEMARAIAMSMQEAQGNEAKEAEKEGK